MRQRGFIQETTRRPAGDQQETTRRQAGDRRTQDTARRPQRNHRGSLPALVRRGGAWRGGACRGLLDFTMNPVVWGTASSANNRTRGEDLHRTTAGATFRRCKAHGQHACSLAPPGLYRALAAEGAEGAEGAGGSGGAEGADGAGGAEGADSDGAGGAHGADGADGAEGADGRRWRRWCRRRRWRS